MPETATPSSKLMVSIPKAIRVAQRWEAELASAFISKGTDVLLVSVDEQRGCMVAAEGG